jgi:hypothetical protein
MKTQSTIRLGLIAALAASALAATALAVPASAATSTQATTYSTGGSNAAANVVPALPDGVTFTKVSAGTTQTLYLRSDGQVVGAGTNTAHSLDIPELPAGVTYVDVDGTGDVTILVRSDGKIVYASDPYAQKLAVPELPAGVTYKKVFSSGTNVVAIRSDRKAVYFPVYWDDRFLTPEVTTPTPTATPTETPTATPTTTPTAVPTATPVANPAAVYYEKATTDSDYTTASVSSTGYFLLMHADGRVKSVDIRATKTGTLAAAVVPKVPKGMRYLAIDASTVAVYVRSDGEAVTAGTTSKGSIKIPALPKGVSYKQANAGDYTIALIRSDGFAVIAGYSDAAGVTPTLTKIAKGYRYTALSNNASHLVIQTEKLASNVKVQTSISKVTRPTTVKHGETATYKVKVFSTAATRGGQVKITYKGKTIGTGVVGAGAVATVVISTDSMPTKARNKVGIAYLGIGNAKKSTSGTKYVGYIRTKK